MSDSDIRSFALPVSLEKDQFSSDGPAGETLLAKHQRLLEIVSLERHSEEKPLKYVQVWGHITVSSSVKLTIVLCSNWLADCRSFKDSRDV